MQRCASFFTLVPPFIDFGAVVEPAAPSLVLKKALVAKCLSLGDRSGSVQGQLAAAAAAAVTVNAMTKHYGVLDLRPPSEKFEQTLKL
ncbi:hypothetical protein GUJ93_ZPchr0002g25385 [Zizania palustris]|uniref:Uncharacterized protein n=1 Tax=Zizania palustris TaxID=103762 RepID=A0A8J5RRX5_ZIZPA|nr:hypothetical protein GUJ93_ZPchr0002g25385 [Zizania palustris]